LNIINFKPLEAKKNEAMIRVDGAKAELKEAQDKLNAAETKVAELNATLKKAQDELKMVEEKCALLEWKSDLAGRLVNGLKDEYVRWKGNVNDLEDLMRKIVSVNLISSGFVSYLGPYDLKFREKIWDKDWMVKLSKSEVIPFKEGIDPLTELVENSTIAEWINLGLPDDRFSKENAAIIEKCKRWPLIIDPQLQAAKYLKQKFQDLEITSFTEKGFELKVKDCIQNGKVLIIENVQEELEPSLEPVLQRAITTKSKRH